jgi:hypothetical protein
MTGFAIIIPVFPQRLQALGLGPETLALMEGAFGLGMFLLSTPMGIWSGRIGRKPILFISLAGFIVTNLLLAFVNVPLLFVLIRFVEGMLISGLIPAAMSTCCVSITGGFHIAGCIHFLQIRSLVPTIFSWDGCVGESACILFDVYPNRMVLYFHEHCLLEGGNASLWMDDPSEP